jgi:hypothetical protein
MQIQQTWSASSSDMRGEVVDDLTSLVQGWSSPLCISVMLPSSIYVGPVEIHVAAQQGEDA